MITQKPTIDLADLRAKAEAAIASSAVWPTWWVEDSALMLEAGVSHEDTAHIAANSPEVTLSLISSLEAVRVAVERAKAGMQDGPQSQSSLTGLETLIEELEKVCP